LHSDRNNLKVGGGHTSGAKMCFRAPPLFGSAYTSTVSRFGERIYSFSKNFAVRISI